MQQNEQLAAAKWQFDRPWVSFRYYLVISIELSKRDALYGTVCLKNN
jgi:hypothetical protein